MDFSECVEFCENHNIKWMPANLDGKTPMNIKHSLFDRLNKEGKPTRVPNYTEFKTLTEADLMKRQKLLLTNQIIKYVDNPKNIRVGIDTYEIFQIDIDTEDITEEFKKIIDFLDANTAYYKSISKSYGRHYFIKVDDLERFKMIVKERKPDAEGIRIQTRNKNIELLCGQWGYIKPNTHFINAEKIEVFEVDKLISILDLPERKPIKAKNNNEQNPDETENVILNTETDDLGISREEITQHMQNVALEYIDCRNHHFKLICAILNSGYEDIARECMFRSSNTKNKDLGREFEEFKKGNNGSVSLKSLLYYSKISNEKNFNKIIAENRTIGGIHPSLSNEIFKLKNTTEKINVRFLPSSLLDDMPQNSTLHIKSHLGTGKTTIIKQFLKKNEKFKVLYFAPRIAFANDIFNDLKDVGFCMYNTKDANETNKVITQLESVWKFTKTNYDVVIIDEIESVLKQLTSFKTNKKISKTYEVFEKLVKNAPYLISADAFLSNSSIDTIARIRGYDTITRIVENTFNPYDRIAVEVRGVIELTEKASMAVNNGKNIVFITTQKSMGDNVYEYFKEHNPTAKIGYYYGGMSETKKREDFENVNEKWADLNILIYTPVITCGVNFDPITQHFHKLYMYICPYSCVIRDLFQASLRVRKLIDNDCFYCYGYNKLGNKLFSLARQELDAKNDTLHDIEDNLIKNYDILKEYGIDVEKSSEWIIKNLAYKLYEEQLTNKQTEQITNEYFKICGYEVLAQKKKYYKYGSNPDQEEDFKNKTIYPTYDELGEIEKFEYDALNKQIMGLDEFNKNRLKKYQFNKICFHILQHKTDTTPINELFDDYLRNPEIFTNWIYETYEGENEEQTEMYKKRILYDITENKELSHALQNMSYIKYSLIKKMFIKLFNTSNISGVFHKLKTPFPMIDIVNEREGEFNDLIKDIRPVFGLKDNNRGEKLGKYFVSCFKNIIAEHYGITFNTKKLKYKKSSVYGIYTEHPKINLFDKITGVYSICPPSDI